jgi:hypothetical protein
MPIQVDNLVIVLQQGSHILQEIVLRENLPLEFFVIQPSTLLLQTTLGCVA